VSFRTVKEWPSPESETLAHDPRNVKSHRAHIAMHRAGSRRRGAFRVAE
jgi:hypothetical protein